jgi:hypothetical protein
VCGDSQKREGHWTEKNPRGSYHPSLLMLVFPSKLVHRITSFFKTLLKEELSEQRSCISTTISPVHTIMGI